MKTLDKVTRVEVIGDSGRLITLWDVKDVRIDLQDEEKTLKVFLKGENK
jgi:hypothetical protein